VDVAGSHRLFGVFENSADRVDYGADLRRWRAAFG
jgi:hypothetical protein